MKRYALDRLGRMTRRVDQHTSLVDVLEHVINGVRVICLPKIKRATSDTGSDRVVSVRLTAIFQGA